MNWQITSEGSNTVVKMSISGSRTTNGALDAPSLPNGTTAAHSLATSPCRPPVSYTHLTLPTILLV
eukprot:8349660-Pyramimonas_sp.AAC.1